MPRGAKPGERRGGRAKGQPNKNTRELIETMERFNCNPIEGMIRIAQNKKASLELRGRMYAELAQYEFPKRKAIEVTDKTKESLGMTLEQLFSEIRQLRERDVQPAR